MIKDIKFCLLRIHILLYSEVKSHYLSNQCLNISLQMHKLGPVISLMRPAPKNETRYRLWCKKYNTR